MTRFRVLLLHLPGKPDKKNEESRQDSPCRDRDLIRGPP
jgi:hypothetical protein